MFSCRHNDALITKILTLEYGDCKVILKKALWKGFFLFFTSVKIVHEANVFANRICVQCFFRLIHPSLVAWLSILGRSTWTCQQGQRSRNSPKSWERLSSKLSRVIHGKTCQMETIKLFLLERRCKVFWFRDTAGKSSSLGMQVDVGLKGMEDNAVGADKRGRCCWGSVSLHRKFLRRILSGWQCNNPAAAHAVSVCGRHDCQSCRW